ncbi:MAG: HlyD family type I secretion periplasmic adaptor subunit [Hyphomonadaceae bacterium]
MTAAGLEGGAPPPATRALEGEIQPPPTRAQTPRKRYATDDARGEIRLGLIAIGLFFGLFLGWAALAPLSAAVVAPGVVVVSGNRQTVQHRDGGVIAQLNVVEGQRVNQRQILIELSAPEVQAQERALFSQVLDQQMQRTMIAAEMSGATALASPPEWASFSAEDRAAAEAAFVRYQEDGRGGAWSQFGARIQGYRDEIAAIGLQEASLRDELSGTRQLADEQLVPLTRVRALERALADLQGRRAELRASIAATEQARSEERRRVEARLAELTPQWIGAQAQLERTRLRAPTDGVVVGLTAHTIGGVIRPGERVMDVVPDGQDLVVEAHVKPEDADNIHPGMRTEVKITAFTGRNLPILDGVVRTVSADRLQDERTGQGYFSAQVVVAASELAQLARTDANRRLRAGLPAEIVVPTRSRTALQYLFEPLNQTLWRAFREN